MDSALYSKMQWPEIEALVYSEHDRPKQILGPHITEDGVLIAAFIPDAIAVTAINKLTKDAYPMEKMDEGGYFAVLTNKEEIFPYYYRIQYTDELSADLEDPYRFESLITKEDILKFQCGIHYEVYKMLGAHLTEVDGVKGVHFAVWAPEAIRVSVVGDFCRWDGRRYPMQQIAHTGIHELFIPGLTQGDLYKFEVKIKGNTIVVKTDPYGYFTEERPNTASIVYDLSQYEWQDADWIERRTAADTLESPLQIYEVHLAGFHKPDPNTDGRYFYNYRELAPMLASYVREMGYTHIELMPVMEHPLDESWGYQVSGYYAPTSRYGTPDDFKYFMDYMHQQGIGVILDWVPAHFPRDLWGLSRFDGSCLYEHPDPRRGSHPHWGTLIFNYGRPEVSNFLIASALYWIEQYHADGLRLDAVASMLYLDYGKKDGEWLPNIYGGNENLEACELLKHLNSIMKKRNPGVIMIAEESTAWPRVSYPPEENGLGFDYKWNMGWMNDFLSFMKLDPLFRKYHYNELLFSMIYAYSENFILGLSHDEVVHEKCSLINKMPGEGHEKYDNLRAAYGFMAGHPGKKLLFMGQEFAQEREFSEARPLDWELLEESEHLQMQTYVKDLNHLYLTYPAFYKMDQDPDGFEWINCINADETMVIFVRKTERMEDTLLFVCNFTPVVHESRKIGVPFAGKYKEILNSDAKKYGGQGYTNPRAKQSKKEECDDKEDSITITVPPMGISIFTCTPKKGGRKVMAKEASDEKTKTPKTAKEITQDLSSAAAAAGKAASDLSQALQGAADLAELAQAAGKTAGKAVKKAGKTAKKAAEQAGQAAEMAEKATKKAADQTGQAIAEATEKAGKTAGKAGKAAKKAADQAGKAAAGAADKAGQAAGKAADNAGKAARKAAEQAGQAAEMAGKAAKNAADQTGQAIAEATEKAGKTAEKAGKAAKKAADQAGQAAEMAGKAAKNAADQAGKAAAGAGAAASKRAADASKKAAKATKQAADQAKKTTKKAKESALTATKKTSEAIREAAETVKESADSIKQSAAVKETAEAVKEAAETVKEAGTVKEAAEAVKESAGTIKQSAAVKEAAEVAKEAVGAARETADSVKQSPAMKEAAEVIKEAVGAAKETANSIKQSAAVKEAAEAIKETADSIKQSAAVKEATEAVREAADAVKEAAGVKDAAKTAEETSGVMPEAVDVPQDKDQPDQDASGTIEEE